MASEGASMSEARPGRGWEWRATLEPSQRSLAALAGAALLLALLRRVADGAYALLLAPLALLVGGYLLLRQPELAAPAFAFLPPTPRPSRQIRRPFVVAAAVAPPLRPHRAPLPARAAPSSLPAAHLAFLAVRLAGALLARRPDERWRRPISFLEGLVLYVLVATRSAPAVISRCSGAWSPPAPWAHWSASST
jgi:hypothetical protein